MSVGDVSELSGRGVRCVLLSSSSLSVQSLKKKPPITDGVYSVVVVRYVCR